MWRRHCAAYLELVVLWSAGEFIPLENVNVEFHTSGSIRRSHEFQERVGIGVEGNIVIDANIVKRQRCRIGNQRSRQPVVTWIATGLQRLALPILQREHGIKPAGRL